MKKLLALLLFASSWSWGAIAYVQSKTCGANSASTSSCAFDTPVTAGSLLIVGCATNKLAANLSVTDDNGNNYTLINGTTTTTAPTGTDSFGIWFATNAAAGFTTVTCTDISGTGTWIVNPLHEYSGAATANAFDVWSSSISNVSISTTNYISGYATTSRGNELMFGFAPKAGAAIVTGNGNVRTRGAVSSFYGTEDAIVSVAGPYQSSFTVTSGSYVNFMAQAAFFAPLPPARGVHTWQ